MNTIQLLQLSETYIKLMRTSASMLWEVDEKKAKVSMQRLTERWAVANGLEEQWNLCMNKHIVFFSYMAAIGAAQGTNSAEGRFRAVMMLESLKSLSYDFPETSIKLLFPKKRRRKR